MNITILSQSTMLLFKRKFLSFLEIHPKLRGVLALCWVPCSTLGVGKEVSTLMYTYYYSTTAWSCSATQLANRGVATMEGGILEREQGQTFLDCPPSAWACASPVSAGWSILLNCQNWSVGKCANSTLGLSPVLCSTNKDLRGAGLEQRSTC